MKDYTTDLDHIQGTLYDLNNNLCLLIEILAQSKVNESHTMKNIEREISRN